MVTSVDSLNLVSILFSEPVVFKDYAAFSGNLSSNINGPSSPYTFTTTIIDPTNLLQENTSFTNMYVSISNVQATLNGGGSEKIELWWEDLSVITDLSNNTLSEGKIVGYLSQYEYIPPATKAAAASGGSSMKYTLISMFSVNFALKFVISSSAALMWSLIHVLQSFRFILMMNIRMPGLIDTLLQYLVVVIGEVDEVEARVPDLLNMYIINQNDIENNVTIFPRFVDHGYDSPYLTDLNGQKFILLFTISIIFVPALYIFRRNCSRIKRCKKKLDTNWQDLFWNAPLRTFVELYIELALGFYLQSLNIRFMTYSGIIVTLVMFI